MKYNNYKFLALNFIYLILINFNIFSQTIDNKIYSNWIFGENCNIVFELGNSKYKNLNFEFKSEEGVSSITSLQNKISLTSNGIQLYDENGLVENGESLLGHLSSTQSNLILQIPEINDFIIFTVSNLGKQVGLNYSLIEFDNINKKYIVQNKNRQLIQSVTERLSSTNHLNDIDKWICVKGWRNENFYVFKLTKNGVDSIPVISQVSTKVSSLSTLNTVGQMKFSPNGNLLAMVTNGSNLVEIFDFDKVNGKLSFKYSFSDKRFNAPYGLEFSPDNNLIYISYQVNKSAVVQYNLSELFKGLNIENCSNIITTNNEDYIFGSLQLTPDYNICISKYDSKYLDIINLPNSFDNCNFILDAISLGAGKCKYGLPNSNSSEFLNFTDSKYSFIKYYKIETDLINLVGDAKIENDNNYNELVLNNDKTFQKGAFWTKEKVNIRDFDVFFKIKLSKGNNNQIIDGSPEGADGFAFVINNYSNKIIGEPAGGIGYSGIPNSFTIEFDCFKNNFEIDNINDPNGSHIAINSNGVLPNSSYHNNNSTLAINDSIFNIKSFSDIYFVRINYKNNNLNIYFDTLGNLKEPILTLNNFDIFSYINGLENINNDYKAYIGITSSTGNAVQKCEILSFTYNSDNEILNSIYDKDLTNYISDNLSFKINTNKLTLKFEQLNNNNYKEFLQNINIKLCDLNGKLIIQKDNINFIKNIVEIPIDINLNKGLYFLNYEISIQNKLFNFTSKFIFE